MARTRNFDQLTKEQRIDLARKGGLAVSQNKSHMSEIGRKGGMISAAKRKAKRDADIALNQLSAGDLKKT